MRIARSLGAAAILAALAPAPAFAQQLGIGTMAQGTAGYSMASAIAKTLADKGKVNIRVQPAGGTSQYVPLIDSGELDFGVVNIIEAKEALTGQGQMPPAQPGQPGQPGMVHVEGAGPIDPAIMGGPSTRSVA